ncbi:MAG: hypothetical protein LUG60_09275 [Erysipelotrichaceae bacterium]|nr:hypothetical protein [Erysipelotrichaceae bacterium]
MNWLDLYMKYFGTTTLFGIDLGFYITMFIVLVIVILMNVIEWNLKPKVEKNSEK